MRTRNQYEIIYSVTPFGNIIKHIIIKISVDGVVHDYEIISIKL